ncbi:MAG: ABC transporter ATP-binding protein [Candidatus Porifericomitaceae bacterium WSBS_2022_MAG_OTU9]
MEALLCVKNVSRNYGNIPAVSGVNLELHKGQILGLLGLNGAGKSTLLKMICGVLAPHEGWVHLAGHDMVEDAMAARSHIGFMPEQAPLYHDLTVHEALVFQAKLHGIRAGAKETVTKTCELCGLAGYENRLCGHLSHGYRKRLGIAQALVHQPQLLVLDEPSSGLDPMQTTELRKLIQGIAKDCAIIFSSHALTEVQELCDRVFILHQGHGLLDQALTGQETAGFTVVLEKPPAVEQLQTIINATVSSKDGYRFHIVPHNQNQMQDARELLLRQSLENGWALKELLLQRTELEQTFLNTIHSANNGSYS